MAEEKDLKSFQCQFESDNGYPLNNGNNFMLFFIFGTIAIIIAIVLINFFFNFIDAYRESKLCCDSRKERIGFAIANYLKR